MEPILELATQITSHLWLFHELYPDEADIGDVLSSDWREMLEQQAAADYSRLQALLDLTGRTQPGDWDPTNPLGRFKVSGQKEEKLEWKAPLQLWRTKSENRRRRQEQSAELRVNAAKPALDVLRDRVKVLLDQGLPKAVDFLPDQSTLLSAAPTPSLLTREELFEKTANWLLSSQVETVCAIATGFVGCEDEKETATRGDIKQPAGSTATRDPAAMKEEQAERRAREFLMWEEINKQVQSVAKATDGSRETEAQAWKDNEKKPKERLAALLDPRRLRKLCYELGVPVPFSMVLTDELNEIKKSRLAKGTRPSRSRLRPGLARRQGLRFLLVWPGSFRRRNPKRNFRPWPVAGHGRPQHSSLHRLDFDGLRRRLYRVMAHFLDQAQRQCGIGSRFHARVGLRFAPRLRLP
jgi:hypothetical protein